MQDQIRIRNLEVLAHHGVFQEEKDKGQTFFVDATLFTNTRRAGFTDDLNHSINYGTVCHDISKLMQEKSYNLIETVAERVAEMLLLKWPGLEKVMVEIKKPSAPIGLPFENVSVAIERSWHKVYLSIGSNMGDRVAYIDFAVKSLGSMPRMRNIKVSDLYETPAYGLTEQPDFMNGVIELETLFTPEELLTILHKIEADAGRERVIHWGPRTLDLDIVFYDDLIMDTPDLIIPHIDMANRMFVLEPLAQLCPGKVHPVYGKTIAQMKKELEK